MGEARVAAVVGVLLIALFWGASGDYLEQKKVVLVDATSPSSGIKNFLFRGNEPKIYNSTTKKDEFAYSLLKRFMTLAATKEGIILPQDFILVDIKLYYFNDTFEYPDIKLEQDFFRDNPSLGRYIGVQIWGDSYSPAWLLSYLRDEWATELGSWQHDNLPGFIPELRLFLTTKQSKPVVYYFHCEVGADRTGEIAGSYVIAYKNWTLAQAVAWDVQIAGRWILPNHEWAIQWYCYYLKNVFHYPLTCSTS